jgi:hypothetical protein
MLRLTCDLCPAPVTRRVTVSSSPLCQVVLAPRDSVPTRGGNYPGPFIRSDLTVPSECRDAARLGGFRRYRAVREGIEVRVWFRATRT